MGDSPKSVLLLAGGRNERMSVLRGTTYKAFLELEGGSMVGRQVQRLSSLGFTDIAICVDTEDIIVQSIVKRLRSELSQIGLVNLTLWLVAGSPETKTLEWIETVSEDVDPPFTVVVADTLANVDYGALRMAVNGEIDSAIAVVPLNLSVGVVRLLEGGVVDEFIEKPVLNDRLVNTGHMCLGPMAVDRLRSGHSIGAVLESLAKDRKLAAVTVGGGLYSLDSIGDIERLAALATESGSRRQ